ncbi:cystine/glutamate transporter-like [Platysternon megacephalum]|uniref:Cystine/glutamate transporter-like n=1 Tax=Platysternon megacephalum TaxID=55544 RepID=A0A4D9E6Y4_9SAUR|nr:cystine/glutamate transporter-like [Platysternon megacephalum]
MDVIFLSGCHHLKCVNENLLQILSFEYRAASYEKIGSILNKINSAVGSIMQIAFSVSVSILLKLIQDCNCLILVEPGKYEQLKQYVNLLMLFFKCRPYIIVDKIDININGFYSLLHYVNSVVVELIFLQLFTSAITGKCLYNDLHYKPLQIKTYHR